MDMKKASGGIGIICPVPVEYAACVKSLGLAGETVECGRKVSRAKIDGVEVTAIAAGPGKIRCASAAQYLISGPGCGLIIDTGSAGALVDTLAIGDIVFCTAVYEYDILPLEKFRKHIKEMTGLTALDDILKDGPTAAAFRDFCAKTAKIYGLGVAAGVCASGEKNVDSRKLRETLASSYGCSICDWETAAVVKTANLCGVKCLSIRSVSDMAGEGMIKEYKKNAGATLGPLYRAVDDLIRGGGLEKLGFDI